MLILLQMNETELAQFCSEIRYLVVDEYQQAFVFKTLRETADMIGVNYTTISKKLNGDALCIVTSKASGCSYAVTKLSSTSSS